MALDIHSPMDLVYECFVKLGLRYICVTKNGQYAGLVRIPVTKNNRMNRLILTRSGTQENFCKVYA